jgi:hypothetical protein
MGKSRMMGAGYASSTLYKSNPNVKTGGGNKKQGITSRVGLNNWENREIQTQSNGIGRFKLVCMNQLGGIGPGHSMFGGRWNRTDGVHCPNTLPDASCLVFTESATGIKSGIDGNKIVLPSSIPYNVQNVTKMIVNVNNNNKPISVFIPVKYVSNNTFIIQLPDTFISSRLNEFDKNIFFTVTNKVCLPLSTVIVENTTDNDSPVLNFTDDDELDNIIEIVNTSPISSLPANIVLTNNNDNLIPLIFVSSSIINETTYIYRFTSYESINYGLLTKDVHVNVGIY